MVPRSVTLGDADLSSHKLHRSAHDETTFGLVKMQSHRRLAQDARRDEVMKHSHYSYIMSGVAKALHLVQY
jgi:hypothetical protein